MPQRSLARARLLGEHVIVVQPHRAAAHQLRGNLRQRGLENEAPVELVVLPVTEILDETSRVVGAAGELRARTGLRKVGFYARAQQYQLLCSQQLPQAKRAIALKGGDLGGRHHRLLQR